MTGCPRHAQHQETIIDTSDDSRDLERLPALERELRSLARAGATATYRDIARRLELTPPHTIHRTALLLEALMERQAVRGEPQLASLVVSRARQGLPAPGFFLQLQALNLYEGPAEGPEARRRHAEELRKVFTAADTRSLTGPDGSGGGSQRPRNTR